MRQRAGSYVGVLAVVVGVVGVMGTTRSACAQAFNLDLGSPSTTSAPLPSAAFEAAGGQAGVWQRITPVRSNFPLINTAGQATGVTINTPQVVSMGFNSSTYTGDNHLLMDDGLVSPAGPCAFGSPTVYAIVRGLTSGTYRVYVYGGNVDPVPLWVYIGAGEYTMTGANLADQYTNGVNCMTDTVTTTGTLTVSVYAQDGSSDVYVSGVQIVPVSLNTCTMTAPALQAAVVGDTATFTVAGGGDVRNYRWMRDGQDLADVRGITGSGTATLSLADVRPSDAGLYAVRYQCGGTILTTPAAALMVSAACGSSDFNGDGDFGTDADIQSFFSVLGGAGCVY